MREIGFRGKRKDNRKWVYGGYMRNIHRDIVAIWEERDDGTSYGHEVIPETVGEYTGLKDKNGVKVFEGDIVELTHALGKETGVIRWSKKECAFMLVKKTGSLMSLAHASELPECVEVIRNVHDNPELLGRK
jgi:uncharacterized phage protein (TIGR01671 family)